MWREKSAQGVSNDIYLRHLVWHCHRSNFSGVGRLIKTVLVAGAPWPPIDTKIEVKKKAKPKSEQTDINFEAWVQKQKKINDFGFLKEKS